MIRHRFGATASATIMKTQASPCISWCPNAMKTSAGCTFLEKNPNILRPRQNGRYFADEIFKFTSLYQNCFDSDFTEISQHWFRYPALNHHQNQPTLLTHLCRTRPQSWWRHQMEHFSALLAFCAGNSPVTGEFPIKGKWRGALMFSLICTWTNGWVNNRDAGDLRWNPAHYDVTVISWRSCVLEVHVISIFDLRTSRNI